MFFCLKNFFIKKDGKESTTWMINLKVSMFSQVSIMGRGSEEKLSAKRDKSHVLFGGTKILQHTPDKVAI